MPTRLHAEYRALVKTFNSHGVEYLLIGAHALAMHGIARNTFDVDFLVNPTRKNSRAVVRALAEFGFSNIGLRPDDLAVEHRLVTLGRPPLSLDIVTSISGVSFKEAWESRQVLKDGTLPVQTIGLEALLKNKRASDREKDKPDIRLLEEVLKRKRSQPRQE